jgi:hypothetical protein
MRPLAGTMPTTRELLSLMVLYLDYELIEHALAYAWFTGVMDYYNPFIDLIPWYGIALIAGSSV